MTSSFPSAILIATLAVGVSQRAQGISLAIQPLDQEVTLGSPVTLSVSISGLGAGISPSLGAFDFDLQYNPAILSLNGVTFGDPSSGDQLAPTVPSITGFSNDPVNGLVNQFEVSLETPSDLDNSQLSSFILTTLSFNALATGSSNIEISNLVMGDSEGDPLFADAVEGGRVLIPIRLRGC